MKVWFPLGEQRAACRPEYLEDEQGFKVKPEQELPFDRSDKQLYPVSVIWQPPFTMMVDLVGAGDLQVYLIPKALTLSDMAWIVCMHGNATTKCRSCHFKGPTSRCAQPASQGSHHM